jgi:hypothetical protein
MNVFLLDCVPLRLPQFCSVIGACSLLALIGACGPEAQPTSGASGLAVAGGGGTPGSSGAPSGSSGALSSGGSNQAQGGGAGSTSLSAAGGGADSTGGAAPTGGTSSGGAGPGGAGPSAGTGGGAGASRGTGCAGKAYKLCEDFETGTTGMIPTGWTTYKGYGTASPQDAVLASDQFHSGTMALKSVAGTSGTSRIQKSLASLGATASTHWGRIFYKVQSPVARDAGGGLVHYTWVGLLGTGENRVVDIVQAGGANGKHQWLYNNPDDKGSKGSAYDYAFDANWHCAEWYVDVSTKSYRFFSDGTEVTSIGFTQKADSEMSDYKAVIVGVTYYQGVKLSPPYTEWFDDLAIDDTQIGCN